MGLTPLHWAVKMNNEKMVKMLLEEKPDENETKPKWKSDPNQEDFFHRTALYLAVQNCNLPICRLLLAS